MPINDQFVVDFLPNLLDLASLGRPNKFGISCNSIVKVTVWPFGKDQFYSAFSSGLDSVFKCLISEKSSVLVLLFHVAVWPVGVRDSDQLLSAAVSPGLYSVFLFFL